LSINQSNNSNDSINHKYNNVLIVDSGRRSLYICAAKLGQQNEPDIVALEWNVAIVKQPDHICSKPVVVRFWVLLGLYFIYITVADQLKFKLDLLDRPLSAIGAGHFRFLGEGQTTDYCEATVSND
jgi:hypothetical protein